MIDVVFDMDGVLFNFIGKLVRTHNLKNNDCVKEEHVDRWITKKDCHPIDPHVLEHALTSRDFFEDLDVIDGAYGFLSVLNENPNFEIAICSSSPENACASKMKAMRREFPFVKKDNIAFMGNKRFMRGDILIDDKPENLDDFIGIKILFKAPHNQHCDKSKYINVSSFSQLETIFYTIFARYERSCGWSFDDFFKNKLSDQNFLDEFKFRFG